jgi:hypothetical protein
MTMSTPIRFLSAGALGLAAALLVSCGSSGKSLIPAQNADPLQSDFDAVAQAAQTGDGECATTAAAIRKTEADFRALPSTVDAGLHHTLSEGISNLHERALALCAHTATTSTTTSTTSTQPTTSTTTTSTQTTSTSTTSAPPTSTNTTSTSTTPTPPGPGGGTPAPGEQEAPGAAAPGEGAAGAPAGGGENAR